MKLVDFEVKDFIEKVASNSPAPGGGSVSALALSLGTALTTMVGALTTGKKRFKTKDETIQNDFKNVIDKIKETQTFFNEAIDKDTEAFNLIMSAFKMPKETEEDQKARSIKIQKATIKAIEVPFSVAEKGIETLNKLDIIVKHGNPNTISDIGVAVLMMCAGIEGAILNVKINLPGLQDVSLKEQYEEKVTHYLALINDKKDALLNIVYNAL